MITRADLQWVSQWHRALQRGCRARLRGGNPSPGKEGFVRRVWGGDQSRFLFFVRTIASSPSLPPATCVYVSGSAATGYSFLSGRPFDHNGVGTSDIDLVLIGPHVRALFPRGARSHLGQTTYPFPKECATAAPGLAQLCDGLTEQAGRPVSIVTMTPLYRLVLELVNGPSMLRIVSARVFNQMRRASSAGARGAAQCG